MNVLVSDNGFKTDDEQYSYYQLDALPELLSADDELNAVVLSIDTSLETIENLLSPVLGVISLIKIEIPSFSDGRGFTLARQLRLMGYTRGLRASGNLIADQYTMARRCGFDEVEVDDQLAARQPEAQWLYRSNWKSHNYQSRLKTTFNPQ